MAGHRYTAKDRSVRRRVRNALVEENLRTGQKRKVGKREIDLAVKRLRRDEITETGAAAQHSQSLEAWFCHVPGLKVVIPSTPYDAKGLLKAAIRDDNPVMFIEQKLLYRRKGLVPEEDYVIPLGKADVKREGTDVTLVSYGRMVPLCLEVAEAMKGECSIEVVDLRTLVPMDKETVIKSVCKTGRVVIVHEACTTGGYGGEIAAVIGQSEAFFHLDAPITRCCGLDVPIPYCPELEKNVVPTFDRLTATIRGLL